MGDHDKGLAEVKVNHIHCFPFTHRASLFIVEGNRVGQAQFALGKSMLAVPNHLFCCLCLNMAYKFFSPVGYCGCSRICQMYNNCITLCLTLKEEPGPASMSKATLVR